MQEIRRSEIAACTSKPGPIKTRISSSISYDGNGRSGATCQRGETARGLPHRKAGGSVRTRCCEGEDRLSKSVARNSARYEYQHFRMACVEPRHRYHLAAVGGRRGGGRLDPWHSPAPSADWTSSS